MGRSEIQKTTRLLKRLEDDDLERVHKLATRLAEDSADVSQESLGPGDEPSYLAAADPQQYEREKEKIERGMKPDPSFTWDDLG